MIFVEQAFPHKFAATPVHPISGYGTTDARPVLRTMQILKDQSWLNLSTIDTNP